MLHKLVKVDEQWIPREGGKRLVGGIAVSGVAYRQHLPVLLTGFLEPVGEFFSFRPNVPIPYGDGRLEMCISIPQLLI